MSSPKTIRPLVLSGADIRAARVAAKLTVPQAAKLVFVSPHTWQRWEYPAKARTRMPRAAHELFLLLTGGHPVYELTRIDWEARYAAERASA